MDDLSARASEYSYSDLGTLLSIITGDEKHARSSESTIDIIWALYDRVLNISPDRIEDPDRDYFLLSKGHGPAAYYAVLTAKGFIPVDALRKYGQLGSNLGYHPDRTLIPGVEISSGSLGHGLPLATGLALGLRAQGRNQPRVFCLIGDGELDEGSNHEAIAYAGTVNLANLTVVVVDNQSSTHGWSGGIATRFDREGWSAVTIDGRSHDEIVRGHLSPHPDRPHAVIAMVGRQ